MFPPKSPCRNLPSSDKKWKVSLAQGQMPSGYEIGGSFCVENLLNQILPTSVPTLNQFSECS